MSVLDDVKAAVAQAETVEAAAAALISGLGDKIRAAITDPDGLEALAQQLDAQSASLSAAIAANTPAAPAPAPASAEPAAATADTDTQATTGQPGSEPTT